jgi:hypothetical protein
MNLSKLPCQAYIGARNDCAGACNNFGRNRQLLLKSAAFTAAKLIRTSRALGRFSCLKITDVSGTISFALSESDDGDRDGP